MDTFGAIWSLEFVRHCYASVHQVSYRVMSLVKCLTEKEEDKFT